MFCSAFSWASVYVSEMVQQGLVQLKAVKPDFLTPEKWEPKVVKKRDRQNGTFEVLWEEMNWHRKNPLGWQRIHSSVDRVPYVLLW